MNKKAVTFGRYMLVSYAHLSTVQTILEKWDHLTIGILRNDIKPDKASSLFQNNKLFYQLCEKNWIPEKCIFSVDERMEMWKATINEYQLEKQVDILEIERPECAPIKFSELFPEAQYDLLFPKPVQDEKSTFDLIRNKCFSEVLQRKVFEIEPKLTLHTTDIKNSIYEGLSNWDEYMPESAYQIFKSFNGDERMFISKYKNANLSSRNNEGVTT